MFCHLETLRLIICQPQRMKYWALFLRSEAAAAVKLSNPHDVNSDVILSLFIVGETMVARSWTEMQCPGTGQIKHRKVAEVGG
ncbi:hypothetical protein ACFX2H_033506 [Malus domestica]